MRRTWKFRLVSMIYLFLSVRSFTSCVSSYRAMRCSRQLRAAITAGSYGPAVTSNASTRVATTLKPGKSKASTSRFGLKAGTSSEHRQHDEDFGFGIPVRSQVLAGTRLSRREAARDVNRRSTRASEVSSISSQMQILS